MAQLRRNIQGRLHLEISMLELFRYRMVADMAEHLANAGRERTPVAEARNQEREAGKERLRQRLERRGKVGRR
jgi:hypothetical protein